MLNVCSAFRPGIRRLAAVRTSSSSLQMANPTVYFDLDVGGKDAGRVTFELFADVTPKVLNYYILTFSTLLIRFPC